MKALTCRREDALVLGGAIRLLVLHHDQHRVRLGIDAPPAIEVTAGDRTVLRPRRRDLVAWHPEAEQLCRQIAARYPQAAEDLRVLRTGVAYFGRDPCLLTQLEAYTLGHADATRCCAQHSK
jgi:hypothetical protein